MDFRQISGSQPVGQAFFFEVGFVGTPQQAPPMGHNFGHDGFHGSPDLCAREHGGAMPAFCMSGCMGGGVGNMIPQMGFGQQGNPLGQLLQMMQQMNPMMAMMMEGMMQGLMGGFGSPMGMGMPGMMGGMPGMMGGMPGMMGGMPGMMGGMPGMMGGMPGMMGGMPGMMGGMGFPCGGFNAMGCAPMPMAAFAPPPCFGGGFSAPPMGGGGAFGGGGGAVGGGGGAVGGFTPAPPPHHPHPSAPPVGGPAPIAPPQGNSDARARLDAINDMLERGGKDITPEQKQQLLKDLDGIPTSVLTAENRDGIRLQIMQHGETSSDYTNPDDKGQVTVGEFDPNTKTIRLSADQLGKEGVGGTNITKHEFGHAYQKTVEDLDPRAAQRLDAAGEAALKRDTANGQLPTSYAGGDSKEYFAETFAKGLGGDKLNANQSRVLGGFLDESKKIGGDAPHRVGQRSHGGTVQADKGTAEPSKATTSAPKTAETKKSGK